MIVVIIYFVLLGWVGCIEFVRASILLYFMHDTAYMDLTHLTLLFQKYLY